MANAAPLKATFFAFRKRERSGVLLSATIAFVLVSLVLIGLLVAINLGMFLQLFSQFASAASGQVVAEPDGAAIAFGMIGFFFSIIIFLFFFYVLMAAYEAACLRWMIHGEVAGFLGLSLGAPTWRVYSSYWIWFAIHLGISTAVSLIAMPFMFMGMAGASGGMSDPTVMAGTMVGIQVVVTLLQYVVMAFVGVRFAPAAATSIGERKFSFFTAWTVTKGRFWALFGSFVLIGLIYALVFLVLFVVVGGLLFAQAWPSITSGASGEEVMTAIFASLTPPIIGALVALYVVMSFVGMIFAVMFYGVNARAVLAAIEDGKISGVTPELANTFS
jgi:hypothetical protein